MIKYIMNERYSLYDVIIIVVAISAMHRGDFILAIGIILSGAFLRATIRDKIESTPR